MSFRTAFSRSENEVMKTIREVQSLALRWAGRWDYVLHSGQDMVGKLFLKRGDGMRAVADSADGRWRFEKKWFPSEKVTLLPMDSDTELAVLRKIWLEDKASLVFGDGHLYKWVPTNFWQTGCAFVDAFGEPVAHFRRYSNPVSAFLMPKGQSRGRVEIEYSAFTRPELPILTFLGCYLMILESM